MLPDLSTLPLTPTGVCGSTDPAESLPKYRYLDNDKAETELIDFDKDGPSRTEWWEIDMDYPIRRIDYPNKINPTRIEIYDAQGRRVLEKNLDACSWTYFDAPTGQMLRTFQHRRNKEWSTTFYRPNGAVSSVKTQKDVAPRPATVLDPGPPVPPELRPIIARHVQDWSTYARLQTEDKLSLIIQAQEQLQIQNAHKRARVE